MSIFSFALLPVIGLLIGWATNKLAIWMLFHPKEPINIFGYKFQGVIPSRQESLADKVAEIVSSKLIGNDVLQAIQENTDFQDTLISQIMQETKNIVEENIGLLGAVVLNQLEEKGVFDATRERAKSMLQEGIQTLNEHLDIKALVSKNIMEFDLDELEVLVRTIASQEFKSIEILGGLLGFGIGIGQVLLLLILA